MYDTIKWYTYSRYVDITTGEIITRKQAESKQYSIINKIKKTIKHGQQGIINYTIECKPTGQTQIRF